MTILKQIWDDIKRGENLDLYLTIVVVFGLGILNIVGSPPQAWVTSATLAALGVLAISALRRERHTGEYELGKRLGQLGISQVYQDRHKLPKLDDYLGRAKLDVLIVGISLYGMITSHRGWFERKIAAGCSFRFLLPASLPDMSHLTHLADEVAIRQTRYDLERTLHEVVDLAEKTTPIKGKARVEVRVFNFIPTMGVVMVDSHKRSGSIRIELYPYASPIDKRPAVELQATQEDDCLYDFIRTRYEDLWQKSHPYEAKK